VIGSAGGKLARRRDWPYLKAMSTPQELPLRPGRRLAPAIVVGGAVLGAAVLLGTLVLWFHYGTAVFFEMIASGISACF
jgi:hypothetical protein